MAEDFCFHSAVTVSRKTSCQLRITSGSSPDDQRRWDLTLLESKLILPMYQLVGDLVQMLELATVQHAHM